ncbi:MAG: hypothetical protein JWQ89_2709 [Devosia sp.]|uniref:hypothetical protein n=1 Tax=Devosia sp. TaxID=1871048 RepID=UPI00262548EA|nr:hypothetical protein [Devosia sp.]MDB5540982.1 hypothetical protein [Devosia sp.]
MTDMTTVHRHSDNSADRRRKAARVVDLVRLALSGSLAAVAVTGVLTSLYVSAFDVVDSASRSQWLDWSAAGVGFVGVIAGAIVAHYSKR